MKYHEQNLLGFRIIFISNLLTGTWIPVSHVSVKTWKFIHNFIFIYDLILIGIYVEQIIAIVFVLSFSLNLTDSLDLSVLGIVNLIAYSSTAFRSIYVSIYKGYLKKIFKDMQIIFKLSTGLNYDRYFSVPKSISKIIFFYFFLISFFIALVQITSAISFYDGVIEISRTSTSHSNMTKSRDIILLRKLFDNPTMTRVFDKKWIFIIWSLSLVIQFLSYFKIVCTDCVFLGLYLFIIEQLNILRSSLPKAVSQKVKIETKMYVNIEQCLQFQHLLSNLMRSLNEFCSPAIVVSILTHSASMCFTAFVGVKSLDNHKFMIFLSCFCLLALLQTFFYCYVGYKVKLEGGRLSESICRSSWTQAHPTLSAGLNLVALDCGRSFLMRGGSFFTLSLEFFTSIVGAVLTYLVVLLQFKET